MFGEKDDGAFRNFGGGGGGGRFSSVRKGKGKGKSNGKPADPKQLDQELSKYFGKEPDGLDKENLDTELDSYMKEKTEKSKEKESTEAKETPEK